MEITSATSEKKIQEMRKQFTLMGTKYLIVVAVVLFIHCDCESEKDVVFLEN